MALTSPQAQRALIYEETVRRVEDDSSVLEVRVLLGQRYIKTVVLLVLCCQLAFGLPRKSACWD